MNEIFLKEEKILLTDDINDTIFNINNKDEKYDSINPLHSIKKQDEDENKIKI